MNYLYNVDMPKVIIQVNVTFLKNEKEMKGGKSVDLLFPLLTYL